MPHACNNKTNRFIWPVFYEEARICAIERSKGQTQGGLRSTARAGMGVNVIWGAAFDEGVKVIVSAVAVQAGMGCAKDCASSGSHDLCGT